jgi:hypothetical protein
LTLPFAILVACLIYEGHIPQPHYERKAFSNQSGAAWRITLVEGREQQRGKMEFHDKFSGKVAGSLEKPGDSLVLAPGTCYLVDLAQDHADFHHTFILADTRGNYAEFVATVPYRANPQMTLSLVHQHVGSPLNRGSQIEIIRAVDAAVRKDGEDLTILQNFIGLEPVSVGKAVESAVSCATGKKGDGKVSGYTLTEPDAAGGVDGRAPDRLSYRDRLLK